MSHSDTTRRDRFCLCLPNMHVEYLRVEPPGIPTAFWRSSGLRTTSSCRKLHDELAAAAKQDPVAYRRALLDKSPRAKGVLELAAQKAGWGKPLRKGVGRGVSVQHAFATYMAQVPKSRCRRTEQFASGASSARSIGGTVVNPNTVQAQLQSGIIFGITAGSPWRDHAEGRSCRAEQFPRLPDAADERDAGDRGSHREEQRGSGRDRRDRKPRRSPRR